MPTFAAVVVTASLLGVAVSAGPPAAQGDDQSAPATAESARELRVVVSSANVRSEPSLNGRVLYQVHRGEALSLVRKTGSWLLVTVSNRPPGYVRSDLVEE